jgi:hypothetical protein
MRQHNLETNADAAGSRARRPAVGRLIGVTLLLALVTTSIGGCVLVPVGDWGYGHPYHRGYDGHGAYRGERGAWG